MKKKEKNPILVIFCIFLLLSLIIVPPVFRKYIPKEKVDKSPVVKKNNISILNCSKIYQEENLEVTSKTKYINQEAINNVISYHTIAQTEEMTPSSDLEKDNQQINKETIVVSAKDELQAFLNLNHIKSTSANNTVTVTVDYALIKSNPDNQTLKSYLENLEKQKKSYENKGFSCTTMES